MLSRTNKKETRFPEEAVEVAKEAEATTLVAETEEVEEAAVVVAGAEVAVVVERPRMEELKWQQTARRREIDHAKESHARNESLRMQQDIQRQRNQKRNVAYSAGYGARCPYRHIPQTCCVTKI